MKKYVLMVIILVVGLFVFCASASAATTTTVTSLMNVLTEQKKQAVYNIKLNAPFSKGDSGIKESVNPETGEIIVTNQVVNLPGRNGQDLILNLKYRSRDAKLFEETTKSTSVSNGYGQTIIVFYDVFDTNGYWLRTGALCYPTSETTILGQTTINNETWVFNGYLQYESGTSLLTSSNITNATRAKSLVDEAKYAFGIGWSLDIPSLTVDGENVYAHLPSGKTYEADFSAGVGLKDYELTNIVFTKDTTYSNGTDASAYKLYYANGQAYYFTAKGELLCKKDRFNNTIVYYWTDNSGKRLLTRISDAIGRIVDIEYNDTQILFKTEGKTIRVLRTLIPGQTNKYYLSAYIDPAGRKTTYSYTLDTAAFDSVGKTAATNQYANLADILYPTGARTRYLFTKGTKNLGSSGYMEYYKVKERWDIAGVKTYNRLTYQYGNEPDGYPQYKVSTIDELYKYSTSLVDSNGVVTTTLYNGKHFPYLKTVKEDRLLSETKTDFNPKNNLPNKIYTKTFNEEGQSIENIDLYEYDHRGNLVMENHPENKEKIDTDDYKTWYTYDYQFNLLTDKKYRKDAVTTVEIKYELSDDKKTTAAQNIYSNDDLISAKKYTYDDHGNTVSEAVEKEPGEWVTTRFEYDSKYQGAYLTAVIAEGVKDANGNSKDIRTESQYEFNTGEITETTDGNGKITQYQYDKIGRVTKELLPDKNSRVYHYDDTNNILKVTNANKNTLVYNYDALGKLTSVLEPNKKTTLVKIDYDEQEKLVSQTDGNKNIQSILYDEFGRISKVCQVDKTGQVLAEKKVSYDEAYYDRFKNSFLKIEVTIEGDTKDNIIKYYFDRYERMAKLGRINGEKEEFSYCSYDFLGNQTESINFDNTKTTYQYDALGQLLKIKDALGNNTSYKYDRLGKTISTTNPLGQKSYFEYDSLGRNTVQKVPYDNGSYSTIKYFYDNNSNLVQTIDPEGSITKQQFNSRNFLTSVEQVISSAKSNITEAEYDEEGNLTKVRTGLNSWTDPDYAVNTYHYDNLNRLITSMDNGGQSTSYDYDANGNITKTTDRNNISTYYTYDGLNRVIKKQNGKDGANNAIEYSYNLLGNCIRMDDPSGTTLYKYDQLGRLNTINYSNGIKQFYSYDRADRVTSFQIKQGSVTEMDLAYSYDQLGRLTVVRDQGKAYSYQYDAAGRLTKEENGLNGINTDYTYYDSGNIKSLNHFSGDSSLLDAYEYRYDKRGNQVEKIENGDVTRYYYDSLSRLKTAILPDNTIQNYEFDDLNNIKAMAEITKTTDSQSLIKETTYSYDRNSRLLLAETIAGNQTEQQRFTYDNEGNQLSKEENTKYQGNQTASKEYTYQYNGYNQLSRVIDPNQKIIEYTYNGSGLRTKKDFIDHATQYYYNGQNIVLETDQNNRITAKNIRGIQLVSRQTDTQSFYYLHNAHGDVTKLTDEFGKVIKDYSYDPYGNEKTNPVNLFGKNATTELWRQEVEQVDNPFRYCGEYLDEETGNIYLRARYYDPGLGRFTQEDGVKGSLGKPLTLNLYTYCANNPISYIDPSGNGYVWNNYGEIIGTTPGNDYTDTSQEATDTHGGGDMMNKPWKIDNSDSLDCYLNTFINGTNTVLDADYIRQACIQCGIDEGLVSLLLGFDIGGISTANVSIPTIYSGSLPIENMFTNSSYSSYSSSSNFTSSGSTRDWNDYILHQEFERNFAMISGAAGVETSAARAIANVEKLTMTKTVMKHMYDIIKKGPNKGKLSRPYIDSKGSTLLLREIMNSGTPVKDSALKNGLRWDVPGYFRGSPGNWELVVDLDSDIIVHFNFVTK